YGMEKEFDVPADAFDPPPKVVSAVVSMYPLPDSRPRPRSQAAFAQTVTRAFAQRRKMLRRGLGDWAALLPWDELGVAPTARAEEVSVAQFMAMSDALV